MARYDDDGLGGWSGSTRRRAGRQATSWDEAVLRALWPGEPAYEIWRAREVERRRQAQARGHRFLAALRARLGFPLD